MQVSISATQLTAVKVSYVLEIMALMPIIINYQNCYYRKHQDVINANFCVINWFNIRVRFGDFIFKPPPPVGAGGGYMFLGRPSVPPSVRP